MSLKIKKLVGLILVIILFHTSSSAQNWTWVNGANFVDENPVYRTTPGARSAAINWTDNNGNYWLYGGTGNNDVGFGDLCDLWKYDITINKWIWIKGSNGVYQNATYGTQGIPSSNNNPGSRRSSVSWADNNGNLWLYGGMNPFGIINDLWRYNIASNMWTWMKGDNTINQVGVYGTMGNAAPTNKPGSRDYSVGWKDNNNNLWLYGGNGYGAFNFQGMNLLSDLWKYDITTNEWTWMKGDNVVSQPPNYGTMGVSSPSNSPGSRGACSGWVDGSGNFYLFGGFFAVNNVSDLWKYDVTTNEWTWIKGSNLQSQVGTYGTIGVANNLNNPGCRNGAVSWFSNNNLWLYSGSGYAAVNTSGFLNDLWKYDLGTGQWTWMKGGSVIDQKGIYNAMGIPTNSNVPGGRIFSSAWFNSVNNELIFFGGNGYDATGTLGINNDVWKYNIGSGNYTWIEGSNQINQLGNYGILGQVQPDEHPSGRYGHSIWTTSTGEVWLFGGQGRVAVGQGGKVNELWRYNVQTNKWTFIKGANVIDPPGVYSAIGISSVVNTPSGRYGAISFTDLSDNLWLMGGGDNTGCYYDLWKYDRLKNEWTWINGANMAAQCNGVTSNFGTMGVPSPSNAPGPRGFAKGWCDANNNLWFFGGSGDMTGDLWKYDISTNYFTWMKGSPTPSAAGIYGTKGVSSPANYPGGRGAYAAAADSAGNFWLYGGSGQDSFSLTTGVCDLNDLWKYDISSNEWTWMAGGNDCTQMSAVYGTLNVSSTLNTPEVSVGAEMWIDKKGNPVLFGGEQRIQYDFLNSLWRFDTTIAEWTWIKGPAIPNQNGNYGTIGVQATSNMPGARAFSGGFKDLNNNFCLFGGVGYSASGPSGIMNDVWRTVDCSTFPLNITTSSPTLCVGYSSTLNASGVNSYTWNNGSNFSSIIISPTITTTYTVIGTHTNGCVIKAAFTQSVSNCNGTEEISNSLPDIKINPNPTNGEFVLTLPSINKKGLVEVYNSLGQIIFTKSLEEVSTKIDLSNFSNGVYFVKPITEKGSSYFKIVKY